MINLMAPHIKLENLSTYDQIKLEGKLEGIIEGELKRKLEGKMEAKSEVVINLHDMGMDIEFIVQVSVFSPRDKNVAIR